MTSATTIAAGLACTLITLASAGCGLTQPEPKAPAPGGNAGGGGGAGSSGGATTPASGKSALVSAGGADYGGRIYLCLSAAGWPKKWTDYNDPKNVFVDPKNPKAGADVHYWLTSQAQLAVKMQVDGISFTVPHVPPQETNTTDATGKAVKVKDPDGWRMHFEGRMDAVKNNSPMGNAQAIESGLRDARRILPAPAEFILYAGYPDDRDKKIVSDQAYCDQYVSSSIGPYVTAKDDRGAYVLSRVVVDTTGDYVTKPDRPEAMAVLQSIRRQYPWLKVGGEPQPHKASFVFDTGVTTRAAWKYVQKPTGTAPPNWGVLKDEIIPISAMAANGSAPIIFYTGGRLDLDDVTTQITAAPVSVGIFAWTVGEDPNGPKQPGDHERWLKFVAQTKELRKKWDNQFGAGK